MLTTIFDGVPPIYVPGDPNSLGSDTTSGGYLVVKRSQHKPYVDKECHLCHGGKEVRAFSSEVKLTSPIPDLCYQCHLNYEQMGIYMHGPVVVGDCTFCHDAHSTPNNFLLKKPVPELCYRCHDKRNIKMINRHSENSYQSCNRCHDGHIGSNKALLKDSL